MGKRSKGVECKYDHESTDKDLSASERLTQTERLKEMIQKGMVGVTVGEMSKVLVGGGDVNATTGAGDTALIEASARGLGSIVEVLLKHGAAINTKNSYGLTSLMYASKNGHDSVVGQLLRARVDIDVKNSHGKTALQLAQDNRMLTIVSMLRGSSRS